MRPGQIIYARIELLSLVSLVIEVLRIFQATENLFHFLWKLNIRDFAYGLYFALATLDFWLQRLLSSKKEKKYN